MRKPKWLTPSAVEVRKAWRAGNDAGKGFAVGEPEDDINELGDGGLGANGRPSAELGELLARGESGTLAVYWDGELLIAVGDSHGPWAVDVTHLIEEKAPKGASS